MNSRRKLRARWLVAVLGLLAFYGVAFYFGLGTLWVPAMMGTLLFFSDLLAFYICIADLQVFQNLSSYECVTGEPLVLQLQIRAPGAGICSFAVQYAQQSYFPLSPPDLDWQGVPALKCKLHIQAEGVGPQCAGVQGLRMFSPFGLFTKKIRMGTAKIDGPRSVLVLPKLWQLANPPYAEAIDVGCHDRQMINVGELDSVSGNREYKEGDPLNRINWKLTAARREVYVKQFDSLGLRDCSILYIAPFSPELRKDALEAAFAGGALLINHGDLTLWINEEQITIERGDVSQLSRVLARCPNMKTDIAKQNSLLIQLSGERASCCVFTDGNDQTCQLVGALPKGSLVFALGTSDWNREMVRASRARQVNLCMERTGEEWKWLRA